MSKRERIAALEAKVAELEKRVVATEAAAFRRLLPVYPYSPPWYWTYPNGGYGVVTSGTLNVGTNLGAYTGQSAGQVNLTVGNLGTDYVCDADTVRT